MKRCKIGVLFFLPVAVVFSLLLAACFSGWTGEENEGVATVTFTLASDGTSRQLVGLDGNGWTTETHNYFELIVDGGTPIRMDFVAPNTLTASGVPAGANKSLEIRAYGDPTDIFNEASTPGSVYESLSNRNPKRVLRAIGTGTASITAGVVNDLTASNPIVLHSAMDVESWEELVFAAGGPTASLDRKEIIVLKSSGTFTANSTINIDRPIELKAEGGPVTINRFASSSSYFLDAFFNVGTGGRLAIGSTLPTAPDTGTNIGSAITLDGGGNINPPPSAPLITSASELIIGKDVTLQNNNNTASSSGGGVVITAGSLTLKGKIIGNSGSYAGGVYFNGGTTFLIESTARISNNTGTNPSNSAGGVYSTGGTITMKDGAVIGGGVGNGNKGYHGGMWISGGTFNMEGGTISYNEAGNLNDGGNGGGLFFNNTGNFNMSGGTISYNKAISPSSVYGHGGGVDFDSGTGTGGTFTMSDGASISHNTAATRGGGVYLGQGTFEMKGGTISANTAKEDNGEGWGGGVCVEDTSTFNMTGGTIGGGNTADYGGGVYVSFGNFKLGESALIQNNNAITGGGGVAVDGGTFVMSGGAIGGEAGKGNTADDGNSGGNGGGVYVKNSSPGVPGFQMAAGKITHNQAANGGGVCVDWSGTAQIKDTAFIGANQADNGGGVYVANSSTFSISASGNATIGSSQEPNEADYGGGVYLEGGTLNMAGGTITYNRASADSGGGVYLSSSSYFNLDISITSEYASRVAENFAPSPPLNVFNNGGAVVGSPVAGW